MIRGPKPKAVPCVVDIVQDNEAPPATNEDLKAAGLPIRADWMSRATLHEYRTLFGVLNQRRVMTRGDSIAFLTMFRHYEAAQRAQEEMLKRMVVTDERGLLRKSPMAQVFKDHSSMFLRYAVEFGLTPSSRARQGVEIAKEETDEMEALLRGVR